MNSLLETHIAPVAIEPKKVNCKDCIHTTVVETSYTGILFDKLTAKLDIEVVAWLECIQNPVDRKVNSCAKNARTYSTFAHRTESIHQHDLFWYRRLQLVRRTNGGVPPWAVQTTPFPWYLLP